MTPQRVIAGPAWSAGRGDLLGRKYLPARRLPRRRCAAPRNDTWVVAPRNDTWGWLLAMTPQRVIASPAWGAGRGDLLGRKYLPARRLPRRRCAGPRTDTWAVA